MSELYLIAHVVNAQSEEAAEVEFEVASEGWNDEWYTNDGRRVWPFWVQKIEPDAPAIPEGWLEHLAEEAVHYATANREPDRLQALLAAIPKAPTQRIRRR